MDNTSAILFCYAKAAGQLKKSFVGDKINLLFEQNSLSDLWTLIFKEPVPAVPEVLLAKEIEKKALSRFISQYEFFISQFDNPPLVLTTPLRRYEVENLKEICDSLAANEKDLPELIDLHGKTVLKTEFWPDIAAITKDTIYDWLNTASKKEDQQHFEFKLDLQLVQTLWKSIQSCHGDNKQAHIKLFKEEFVIKNVIWALRLLLYYGMSREQIIENLFYVTDAPDVSDPVAGPAIKVLDYDVENYSDWENWDYAKFLNPKVEGEVWRVNPAWIEKSSVLNVKNRAYATFHQNPNEDVALVAWFKLKSFELNCIRTAVESLRLNVGSQEAMAILGMDSEKREKE
jgi:vacuolar-type H+-ATPase subunit C/Vma6